MLDHSIVFKTTGAEIELTEQQKAISILLGLPREYEHIKQTTKVSKKDFDLLQLKELLLKEETKIAADKKIFGEDQAHVARGPSRRGTRRPRKLPSTQRKRKRVSK